MVGWGEIGFAAEPALHRDAEMVDGNARARFEQAVGDGQGVVEDSVIGKGSHGEAVEPFDGAGGRGVRVGVFDGSCGQPTLKHLSVDALDVELGDCAERPCPEDWADVKPQQRFVIDVAFRPKPSRPASVRMPTCFPLAVAQFGEATWA